VCGIIGYIGKNNATTVLLKGLNKLEYRGYDSAGIAVLNNRELKVEKCKGRVSSLENKIKDSFIPGTIGIGHTRWATHGEPSDLNSHPHLSMSGKIAVVHNGIIENYQDLRKFLEQEGFVFVSETDTEVIAHLVEYHYKKNLLDAVAKSLLLIRGSYALGVISVENNDEFITAKQNSPLLIGIGKDENLISSDIPAITEYTKRILILNDGEIASVGREKVNVFDSTGKQIDKEILVVDLENQSSDKSGYEHFMIKEIFDEPNAIRDTICPRITNGEIRFENMNLSKSYIEEIQKIYIVACGTAYHAGVVGKYVIENIAKIPVEVDLASEFIYRNPLINEKCLTILISQSGETADTISALKKAKNNGSKTISIVNALESSIARESDQTLYTYAGQEVSVASTKAYTTQLSMLYLLALDFARKKDEIDEDEYSKLTSKILEVPKIIEEILEEKEEIKKIAASQSNKENVFFMGRGLDYALAMEGSLKLKEISYIHSEAYAGGELKHGTMALIEKGTLVICPLTQDDLIEKMIGNIREVKSRGAIILAITQERNVEEISKVADFIVKIPDIDPIISTIAAVVPLQLYAYYVALERGCEIDRPRNLAKSVTVE
jgi:glutamine---fructose-6-phosphate transaminase (isomerizing)